MPKASKTRSSSSGENFVVVETLRGDTERLELVLANIALADDFPATMNKLEGSIDPDIKLGF